MKKRKEAGWLLAVLTAASVVGGCAGSVKD